MLGLCESLVGLMGLGIGSCGVMVERIFCMMFVLGGNFMCNVGDDSSMLCIGWMCVVVKCVMINLFMLWLSMNGILCYLVMMVLMIFVRLVR